MSNNILAEYDNYDFGFTAVDSEETIVEKPVVNTKDIVQPVNDELLKIKELVSVMYAKLDTLEEVVKASVGNFDMDTYKALVDKESQEKLKKLEALIMPLLLNLKKNPSKDTIKWPNREPIIDAQIAKILAITRPDQ
jgi:hypothetical protein